ncbi:hypothetical protein FRC14_005813 [Serendipita sp. 396]|nr:hypothetical protein FRC14_005813 [Serendipita sp. 396]KAG8796959.1 hypothetical protein FRC16_009346 [Serendipita sp. 398]
MPPAPSKAQVMNIFEETKALSDVNSINISQFFSLDSGVPSHLAQATYYVLQPKQELKITIPPLTRHFAFLVFGNGALYMQSEGKLLNQWDCFAFAPVLRDFGSNGDGRRTYTLVGGKEGGGILFVNDSLGVTEQDIDTAPPPFPTTISSYDVTTWSGQGVRTTKKATLTGLSDLARPLPDYTPTPNPSDPPPLMFNATLEVLIPGTQSSYPHAHSAEDEFIIVLAGKGRYWCDGEEPERVIQAGDCIGWKAGTGLSHALINDGDGPQGEGANLVLLTLGENRPTADKLYYPTKLQNRRHEKWWWKNVPKSPVGGAPDLPRFPRLESMQYPVWETKPTIFRNREVMK